MLQNNLGSSHPVSSRSRHFWSDPGSREILMGVVDINFLLLLWILNDEVVVLLSALPARLWREREKDQNYGIKKIKYFTQNGSMSRRKSPRMHSHRVSSGCRVLTSEWERVARCCVIQASRLAASWWAPSSHSSLLQRLTLIFTYPQPPTWFVCFSVMTQLKGMGMSGHTSYRGLILWCVRVWSTLIVVAIVVHVHLSWHNISDNYNSTINIYLLLTKKW